MPGKGNTGSRKQNSTIGSKKLTPWLAKRFADRALPLAGGPTIGSTILPLARNSGQRHLGDGNGGLARRVINRAGLALASWRAMRLPLSSGVSDFIMRKATLIPTGWQRVLSLPWIRQRRRQGRGPTRTIYSATDWQPASDTGLWSQDIQPPRHARTSPANEEGHLADETVVAHPLSTGGPLPMMTADLSALSVTMKRWPEATAELLRPNSATAMPSRTRQMIDSPSLNELAGTVHVAKEEQPGSLANETYPAVIRNFLSPLTSVDRSTGTAYELSHYTLVRPVPLMTGQMAVLQQREDSEVSKLSYGDRSGIPNRGIYRSEETPNVDNRQMKSAQERLAQVRWQPQHVDLTRLSSRVLTSIPQRTTLQRSLIEARPHTLSESISERHAYPTGPAYQSEETRPEAQFGSVTATQEAVPFMASLPTVQSPGETTGETTVRDDHTLHDRTVSARPVTLLSKALHGLRRSLSKLPIADGVSSRFQSPALQKTGETVVRYDHTLPDMTISERPVTLPSKALHVLRRSLSKLPIADGVSSRFQSPEPQKTGETVVHYDHTLPDMTISGRPVTLPGKALHGLRRSLSKPTIADEVSSRFQSPAPQKTGETVVRYDHTLPDMTISGRPVTLPSKALHGLRRSLNKPTIADEVSRRFEPPILQRMPDKLDGTVSKLPPAEEVSPSEGPRVVPYTLTPQPAAEAGQALMEEAVVSRAVSRHEIFTLNTEAGGGPDRGIADGRAESLLPRRRPLSIIGSAITPLPVIGNISRAVTMPYHSFPTATANVPISAKSEGYGFPPSREYVPSSAGYRYARQPSPMLPVTYPARSKSDSSAARSEELFRYMSDAMPEISHSGNHNGLELALVPAGRAPETEAAAQPMAPEHRAEQAEERQAAPDIRALAREVYPLIKRMIMIERDRHPTWY